MNEVSYRELQPIGTEKRIIHANYGVDQYGRPDRRNGFEERDMPVYGTEHAEAGAKIRARRIKLGLTLGGAARKAGMTASQISRLERGHSTCDEAALFTLWEAK